MQELTFTQAVILPASSPDHDAGTTPRPGTDPYRLADYAPATRLTLERNP